MGNPRREAGVCLFLRNSLNKRLFGVHVLSLVAAFGVTLFPYITRFNQHQLDKIARNPDFTSKLAFITLLGLIFMVMLTEVFLFFKKKYGNYFFYPFIWWMAVGAVLLIGVWPGFFSHDSLSPLYTADAFNFGILYGPISIPFFVSFYVLYPTPAVLTTINILLNALVFAQITAVVSQHLKCRAVFVVLNALPLLMPVLDIPLINHLLLIGQYSVIYAYFQLELALFFYLLFPFNKVEEKFPLYAIAILTGLMAAWRADGILYFLPTAVLFLYRAYRSQVRKMAALAIMCCFSFGLFNFVTPYILKANYSPLSATQYRYLFTVSAAQFILKHDWWAPDKQAMIAEINRYVDFNEFVNTPRGETESNIAISSVRQNKNNAPADLDAFMFVCLKLIQYNPSLFVASKMHMVFSTAGWSQHGGWFQYDGTLGGDPVFKLWRDRYQPRPVPVLHKRIMDRINQAARYGGYNGPSVLHHSWLPAFFIVGLAVLLYRYAPATALFSALILFRLFAIVWFMPATHAMHFFSLYLCQYFVPLLFIAELLARRRLARPLDNAS